jgi:hypothetical protein
MGAWATRLRSDGNVVLTGNCTLEPVSRYGGNRSHRPSQWRPAMGVTAKPYAAAEMERKYGWSNRKTR